MRHPFCEHPSQVTLSEDQDVVEALPAEATEEPLANRSHVRRLGRDPDDLDISATRGDREVAPELSVLAPVAVDRSPFNPEIVGETTRFGPVDLSGERDRRDGVRQARVRQPCKPGLNIVAHGSFVTKLGRRRRYRCTVCGGERSA